MSWDGSEQDYRDSQAAHHEGQQHLITKHDARPFGRWPRRRGLRFDVDCTCGWRAIALWDLEAQQLADEHASYTHGTILQSGRP